MCQRCASHREEVGGGIPWMEWGGPCDDLGGAAPREHFDDVVLPPLADGALDVFARFRHEDELENNS